MTNSSMTLTEFLEKGMDGDFLREMISFMAQRPMDADVEGSAGRVTASAPRSRRATGTVTAIGGATRELSAFRCGSPSYARGAVSPVF